MIETLAKELAAEIRRSKEYEAYAAAKEKALADEQTAALRRMAGAEAGAEEEELKKLAELLQFSPDAADFLLAEYSLNKLLTDTYDAIARGVGIDFSEWGR